MDLIEFIIENSNTAFKNRSYEKAEIASGKCLDVSNEIIEIYIEGSDAGTIPDGLLDSGYLDLISAHHPDFVGMEDEYIPHEILDAIGFINHFAVIVDNRTIIDYTLRQFDESAPYPFVGSSQEWSIAIAKRWNVQPLFNMDSCFSGAAEIS